MEPLNKREDIFRLIKFIDKELRNDFQSKLSEYGLTAQQGRLLFYISCNNKNGQQIRQVDIEKHFQLTKSTVHGLINRMEKANLIIKRKEDNNQYIQISEKTEGILMHVFDKRTECLNKLTKGMSEEEIDQLHSLLTKVLGNKDTGGGK